MKTESVKPSKVITMAKPPSLWLRAVRRGVVDHTECTDCSLWIRGAWCRVYKDGDVLYVVRRGVRRDLVGDALAACVVGRTWHCDDVGKARKRARVGLGKLGGVRRGDCAVYVWPLGSAKTRVAAGERWTDCLAVFSDQYALGGKHNTRRVRYDGLFYVVVKGVRHNIVGELQFDVLECASHVYGVCKESDIEHNKKLKGY